MTLRLARSEAGFTYIAALVMVVVMGIMLGAIGQSVSVIMKREREKELIFRGLQYLDAIERWSKKNPGGLGLQANTIKDLEDKLVNGGSGLKREYFLRKIYKDPITGSDFDLIRDDVTKVVTGVKSFSIEEPVKQDNFPEVIKGFKGMKKYSEWKFEYKKTQTGGTGAAGSRPVAGQQIQPSFPLSTPESP